MAHCALIDIIAVFSSHKPLVARVVRHYLARGFSAIVQVRGVTCSRQGCRALLAGAQLRGTALCALICRYVTMSVSEVCECNVCERV